MQNTSALKTFAQQTRKKLMGLVRTKLKFVLTADTAELRGQAQQIAKLQAEIKEKGENGVVEEVAYTWFNRVMALRYMDANGYNTPMVVTPAEGQSRPEILQEALGGVVDEDLHLTQQEKQLPEEQLYRRLLVAVCNYLNTSMPFLFERISDYTELLLPDDLLTMNSFITDIRNGMTNDDCQQLQIVGWLYQFYITDRKKDAEDNKSRKGGLKSDEQAAATQLFTPDWIVRYMVENTLGRIWMTLHPQSPLRDKMKYYIDPAGGQPDPIPDHIQSVKDISFIDPCMGSGHVLIYAFILFAQMYEEEGYRPKEIPQLIIENNLYGMDIDRRCYQLASFAITMTACRYLGRRYLRHAVAPNVIALNPVSRDVIDATGPWPKDSLMWQFEHIDTIGSLLKVTQEEYESIHVHEGIFGDKEKLMKKEAAFLARKYDCVVTNPPYLGKGMADELKVYIEKEYPNSKADTMATYMEHILWMCLQKGKVAIINQQSWMFLSTYQDLRESICDKYQIESLLHLGAHAFEEIGGEIVQNASFVLGKEEPVCSGIYYDLTKPNSSKGKELSFLQKDCPIYAKLQNSFDSIPGTPLCYWLTDRTIKMYENPPLSNYALFKRGIGTGGNDRFLRSWYELNNNTVQITTPTVELSRLKWQKYNKGGSFRKWYGNRSYVINWENDGEAIKNNYLPNGKLASRPQNLQYNYKKNMSYSSLSSSDLSFRVYTDFLNDQAGNYFIVNDDSQFGYLLGLLNSKIALHYKSAKNRSLNITSEDLGSIPVIISGKNSIEYLTNINIRISQIDWDSHETSWDFKVNPLVAIMKSAKVGTLGKENEVETVSERDTDSTTAWNEEYQSAAASLERLCHPADGVSSHESTIEACVKVFKAQWTARFMLLHANEEELNREFIDIYGLQDELTPDVPLNEITILQQGEITVNGDKIIWNDSVVIKQLISYFVGCLMGRYSVDKIGLIIANQHQDLSTLDLQVDGIEDSPKSTIAIDDDGIIPVIAEESFFADDMVNRIGQAIKAMFGADAYNENMRFIEKALGKPLREYLFKDFYGDHVQMYSVKGDRRPIYWLFSSAMGDKHKKGYFRALVYMHRMEADTLSQLHATYVAPYLKKAETQLAEAENELMRDDLSGPQRNRANRNAEELKNKVREVKEFETKLVEMASHRTVFDLDDGVKANYPKFYPLVEPVKGLEKPKQK